MFQIVHFQKILEGECLNKNRLTAPLYILLDIFPSNGVLICSQKLITISKFSLFGNLQNALKIGASRVLINCENAFQVNRG